MPSDELRNLNSAIPRGISLDRAGLKAPEMELYEDRIKELEKVVNELRNGPARDGSVHREPSRSTSSLNIHNGLSMSNAGQKRAYDRIQNGDNEHQNPTRAEGSRLSLLDPQIVFPQPIYNFTNQHSRVSRTPKRDLP